MLITEKFQDSPYSLFDLEVEDTKLRYLAKTDVLPISVAVENDQCRFILSATTWTGRKRVPGVLEVINYIDTNELCEWKTDSEIKEDVEDEIFLSPSKDSEDIIVTVKNGEVTRKGNVTSWFEAKTVVQNAFECGARTAKAHLNSPGGFEFVLYYPSEKSARLMCSWGLCPVIKK